jgi:hypothetical protein
MENCRQFAPGAVSHATMSISDDSYQAACVTQFALLSLVTKFVLLITCFSREFRDNRNSFTFSFASNGRISGRSQFCEAKSFRPGIHSMISSRIVNLGETSYANFESNHHLKIGERITVFSQVRNARNS